MMGTERLRRTHKRLLFTLATLILALPACSNRNRATFIAGIQPDMVKQVESARQDLRKGDYAMAIARTDLVAFDRPLNIYPNFENVSPAQQRVCLRALAAGMNVWRDAFQATQYRLVDSSEDADVQVYFQRNVNEEDCEVGGYVRWRRSIVMVGDQPKAQTQADAEIRVESPDGGPMTFEQMRHECAHELGHVLGLLDSPRPGEIMSMLDLDHPVGHAVHFEVHAIQQVRRLATEVREEALSDATSKV